jgi:hypothetical protein
MAVKHSPFLDPLWGGQEGLLPVSVAFIICSLYHMRMSEAPRSVDITPPPEDPAWVKTVRWLWHHFRGEGQIIRKAPVATIVIWGVLTYGSYWYLSAHYAERLDNLTTANTALQATVGQLQNELKGASPQLAAMQARRAAVRDKLLEFYVAVGPLIDEKIPHSGLTKRLSMKRCPRFNNMPLSGRTKQQCFFNRTLDLPPETDSSMSRICQSTDTTLAASILN